MENTTTSVSSVENRSLEYYSVLKYVYKASIPKRNKEFSISC